MPIKIIVRVQVQGANKSGEYDFEIPVNMPLDRIKSEIIELMEWQKPGLQWDLNVPCKKNALMEDTMETLLCWDDTALALRSRSIDNDMINDTTSMPEQPGYKIEGIAK